MKSLQSFLVDRNEMLTTSFVSKNDLLRELLSVPSISNDLLPELRVVSLTANQVLYEQSDKIDVMYFPVDSVASGLAIMEDGTTVETSMVGNENVVGASTVLGSAQ